MKMDWLRTSLIAGIAAVCFLLMIRWTDFQEQRALATDQAPPVTQPTAPSDNTLAFEPAATTSDIPEVPVPATPASSAAQASTAQTIDVHTDVLNVTLDLHGGDIVAVTLLNFDAKFNQPDQPFELLKNSGSQTYIATSGLVGANGTDKSGQRPRFSASASSYRLAEAQETLTVDLTFQQSESVAIIKRFLFTRGSHLININYLVQNNSSEPWQAVVYGQIKRSDFNPVVTTGIGMSPYLGAATTTADTNYEKIPFDELAEEPVRFDKQGGWVAMVQHYFLSAFVPSPEDVNTYHLFSKNNFYYLRFTSPSFNVAPQSEGSKSFAFYAGPKDIKTLETVSPYLDLTVDYGILWWIAKPLFYALDFIHGFVGNWGVAIIFLTVLIKILFFYPSAASYRSMAKMRKVQPKMAELKERFGDNKQKFSAEMMKLYREEKVNPLGGCLPILIQMPVFIALYWVLMESVELRHAPFILWIQDLSVKDPYFVLPLIMGATMWIQQKLNPTPPDPMQAKVMQMMPIVFTFMFLVFPAGLVLYWVVNNTLSIMQQYVITKQIENS